MQKRFFASATLACGLAMTAIAAQAQDNFATLGKASASALTVEQLAKVEGKQHIYLLVEFRGVELPARAELATKAAAPLPMGGGFVRSPSREATAFNFLN